MRLSARALNRATLQRQSLLERSPGSVVEGVTRAVALQAQSPPSPYLALWNRLVDFDPAELDAAFEQREVVKASLMRVTLHAVSAADYPPFRAAMVAGLRQSRLRHPRFTELGLTAEALDTLLPTLLDHAAEPRTGVELQARLGKHGAAWWAFRTMAPLIHAPGRGPWSFGDRPSFVAAGRTEPEPTAGLRHLIQRYLEGFGPASLIDFCRFTRLGRGMCRPVWDELDLVEISGPDGPLHDVPSADLCDPAAAAPPRLLGMWDSILLAYQDATRVMPAEYRATITRTNGDVLPALLVDGYVAGVWRPIEDGIEVRAFRPLQPRAWTAIEPEALGVRAFLADREPLVYRRYRRWWDRLPDCESRVFS